MFPHVLGPICEWRSPDSKLATHFDSEIVGWCCNTEWSKGSILLLISNISFKRMFARVVSYWSESIRKWWSDLAEVLHILPQRSSTIWTASQGSWNKVIVPPPSMTAQIVAGKLLAHMLFSPFGCAYGITHLGVFLCHRPHPSFHPQATWPQFGPRIFLASAPAIQLKL